MKFNIVSYKKIFFCLFGIIFLLFCYLIIKTDSITFNYQPEFLYSNSNSVLTIIPQRLNIFGFRVPFQEDKYSVEITSGSEKVDLLQNNDQLIRLKSKQISGEVVVLIKDSYGDIIKSLNIPILPSIDDSDHDGFPDIVELTDESDRFSFRSWFVMIALSQYYHIDDSWNNRDCAGLIRYCYKEALKKHDNKWLKKRKFLYDINLPDIKKYNYPDIPLLGENIFRTNSNAFNEADLSFSDSVFINFAEAKYLKDHNLFFCQIIFRMQNLVI